MAMTPVKRKPKILYSGSIKLSDFYRDINEGFCHFYSADFVEHVNGREDFDFLLCLSPDHYYQLPIVEIVNYFLMKRCDKTLPSMSLTALHEAISNSLLWGLLKIDRPDDFLTLGKMIEEKMTSIRREGKTLQLGITTKGATKFFLINSTDDSFDIKTLGSVDSPYFRGTEIIKSFSNMEYDKNNKTLILNFHENQDAQQAIS